MKNCLAAAALALLAACDGDAIRAEDHLQGVIEFEERHLAFELAGRVREVHVRRGDRVEAGQPLVALDDTLERLAREARAAEAEAARAQVELVLAGTRPEAIRQAAAQVAAAQANEKQLAIALERERQLLARNAGTRARVEDLRQRLEAAAANRRAGEQHLAALRAGARPQEIESTRARLAAAESAVALHDERIARHLLRSAAAGSVLDVHVEQGETVAAGVPVLVLADTARPYVDVFVPVAELPGIEVGDAAQVGVDGEAATFPARVDWIARTTEFTPRFLFSERERPNLVVRVRLAIDDPAGRLHAGIPAFATIEGRP